MKARICSWCPHSNEWHGYGKWCRFPGCGCRHGHVLTDEQLSDGERRILAIIAAAEKPLRTVSIRSRAGEKSHGRASGQSMTAFWLQRLWTAGRVSRVGGCWHLQPLPSDGDGTVPGEHSRSTGVGTTSRQGPLRPHDPPEPPTSA